MKITKIHINNFKSLINLEINNPNAFSVFAGPNGSGKSNIFEALEYIAFVNQFRPSVGENLLDIFGGEKAIRPKIPHSTNKLYMSMSFETGSPSFQYSITYASKTNQDDFIMWVDPNNGLYYKQFFGNLSRVFIGNQKSKKFNYHSDNRVNTDASNLEDVLKRILGNPALEDELTSWIQLFVPEFEKIEIKTTDLSSSNELLFYEKNITEPITKKLISDGSYNILSLLTAVYQSTEPQFLLIEEPENGLHPYVIRELVSFFRQQCEEKGHYIWLNTHSQTLVDELQPHELILVDKKAGITRVKQFPKNQDMHGLKMDFAWLSNALGGGVPW